MGVAPCSQTVQWRDQVCHVQGGRGLEGVLPAAEGRRETGPPVTYMCIVIMKHIIIILVKSNIYAVYSGNTIINMHISGLI